MEESSMANMLMVVNGTDGELFPFLSIGATLKARGHDVTLFTSQHNGELIAQFGLKLVAIDASSPAMTGDEGRVQESTCDDLTRTIFEECKAKSQSGNAVLITHHHSALVTKIIAEKLKLPVALVYTAPSFINSRSVLAEKYAHGESEFNRFRAQIELPPVHDWLSWWDSSEKHIGLWPEWFASHEPSWPAHLSPVGFLCDFGPETAEGAGEVKQPLDGNPPPILITHGKSRPTIPDFFSVSIDASKLSGRGAIVVTDHRDLLPDRLPEGVKWTGSLRFKDVMPRAGAIIHHGDIGILAQAVATGIPQLVVGLEHDGPDNAMRVERLGIGKSLSPAQWNVDIIAQSLRDVIETPTIQTRCRDLAGRYSHDGSLAGACDEIEKLLLARPVVALTSQDGKKTEAAPCATAHDSVNNVLGSLSPERRALLARLLKKKDANLFQKQLISRRSESQRETAPLSYAQQRLWFLTQLDPSNPSYNIHTTLRMKGDVDVDALTHSFNEIVRRHEILRTTFKAVDGVPVQQISLSASLPISVVDLSHLPAEQVDEAAMNLAGKEAWQPFDLSQGPLMRTSLCRLSEGDYVLLITLHHIVSDGWSMDVLKREVAAFYQSFLEGKSAALPELTIQYADYAVWQREWLQGELLDEQMQYWREQLSGSDSCYRCQRTSRGQWCRASGEE